LNSKITDKRVPLVSRRAAAPGPRGSVPRQQRGLKRYRDGAASRQAALRAPELRASPRAARPDRLARAADSRLASDAVAPTVRVRAPAVRAASSPLPPPHAPAVARRRLRAGEPPSPPSPVHRVIADSPSSAARAARLRPWAAPALRTRAAHTLCVWVEPTPRLWATCTVRLGRARIRLITPG
jgi:hypothetical protein